jgi:hypothetical protein
VLAAVEAERAAPVLAALAASTAAARPVGEAGCGSQAGETKPGEETGKDAGRGNGVVTAQPAEAAAPRTP